MSLIHNTYTMYFKNEHRQNKTLHGKYVTTLIIVVINMSTCLCSPMNIRLLFSMKPTSYASLCDDSEVLV